MARKSPKCKYCKSEMIVVETVENQFGKVVRLHCELCHGSLAAK